MNATMTQIRRLPLHQHHTRLGAKFLEFAGWEVPIQYATIVEEHRAVRQKAGLFDVSHMGKFRIRGEHSREFLEKVLSNGLRKIGDGRALYSLLLNERGGVVDDVIVYQISPDHFFMIVNAATREKDWAWLEERRPASVCLEDESAELTILAVQGPASG
ncbi:MAG: glycine cleavage system aminomethyltransferase GcvT, partial [Candidatus Omnitrophica bacterium]|nr:glycine cleavage system aminomethyltransferase GcvT [Candidatus Omnitrophota bacterium]